MDITTVNDHARFVCDRVHITAAEIRDCITAGVLYNGDPVTLRIAAEAADNAVHLMHRLYQDNSIDTRHIGPDGSCGGCCDCSK